MEFKPFDENFSLAGRVALVTGAGAGIGEAIALMFARKGADIIAVDMNAAATEAVVKKITEYGRKGLGLTADITDNAAIDKLLDAAQKQFASIDILVNCAGISRLDDAENLSESGWRDTINLNLSATFFMSQKVGRIMIKQNRGKIINIASQAALVALDNHVSYNASKAGMVAMTQVLACEWAQFNIQVNAISPTVILTELGKKAWAGEGGEVMTKKIPAGRFGGPEEVAAAAVYLASDAANLVTGSNLVIDGGYTIQ
ncbi:MAG: D-threitol dehydrogenase [Planctomycetes bacterium]|nr:D-threitol dehydrogenase [Planctomycetota bacterium]